MQTSEAHPVNYKQVLELYRQAAENGSALAWISLANCYEKGIGVEKNEIQAHKLYAHAIQKGSKFVKHHKIREKLTRLFWHFIS